MISELEVVGGGPSAADSGRRFARLYFEWKIQRVFSPAGEASDEAFAGSITPVDRTV